MTKLEQIEAALRTVDAATFQRLGDAYLLRRGHRDLHPIGLAFGSAKTAPGTPDTLVARPDGRFGFVEYSTQQGSLAEKFADDLAKCFDEAKTGVPVARIAEVVLCYTVRAPGSSAHARPPVASGIPMSTGPSERPIGPDPADVDPADVDPDEILPEYEFRGGARVKYAEGTNVVVLEPDAAAVNSTAAAVNAALRALAEVARRQAGRAGTRAVPNDPAPTPPRSAAAPPTTGSTRRA